MNGFYLNQPNILEDNEPQDVLIPKENTPPVLTLEQKIQKLINMCTAYKEKFEEKKIEIEKMKTYIQELEHDKVQLLNEKHFLEQKTIQHEKDLQELENINKTAVQRIDKLLAECDFDV